MSSKYQTEALVVARRLTDHVSRAHRMLDEWLERCLKKLDEALKTYQKIESAVEKAHSLRDPDLRVRRLRDVVQMISNIPELETPQLGVDTEDIVDMAVGFAVFDETVLGHLVELLEAEIASIEE